MSERIYEDLTYHNFKTERSADVKKVKKYTRYIKEIEKKAKKEWKKYPTLYRNNPWIPKLEDLEFQLKYREFMNGKEKIAPSYDCKLASLYEDIKTHYYMYQNELKAMPKDIEGCKDVIEKYVDAREVLPFMRDVVHRDDITDIVNRSNISTSNGTKELLNCLQRYPHRHLNVPSVWATFEMALKQA
ncbi:uncharacterized protein LOC134233734, partial [Saccostrea cucullata]|uniref:uncharacterized protein LOC134233734 n=1 Tax=Saccostrea cuccullata TaxID=36930 RepID=UPI002ED33806